MGRPPEWPTGSSSGGRVDESADAGPERVDLGGVTGGVLDHVVEQRCGADLGVGTDDYRRVFDVALKLMAIVGLIALLSEKQPSLEFVTPEQLGELTAFLCSEAAAQVRGAAYTMDGGWTAQ